jgi:hypothetical protein
MIGRLTLAKLIFSAIDFFGNDDHLDNYVFTFQAGHRTTTRSESDPTASQQPPVAASPSHNGNGRN